MESITGGLTVTDVDAYMEGRIAAENEDRHRCRPRRRRRRCGRRHARAAAKRTKQFCFTPLNDFSRLSRHSVMARHMAKRN